MAEYKPCFFFFLRFYGPRRRGGEGEGGERNVQASYPRRGGSMYAPVFKCGDYAKINSFLASTELRCGVAYNPNNFSPIESPSKGHTIIFLEEAQRA